MEGGEGGVPDEQPLVVFLAGKQRSASWRATILQQQQQERSAASVCVCLCICKYCSLYAPM